MLRTILLLQGILSSSYCCTAASPFNSLSPPIHSSGVEVSRWSTRRRRGVTFMVPRGGGETVDVDDDNFLERDEEEECKTNDTDDDNVEDTGGVIDRNPSHLSLFSSSSSSLTSSMVHYAFVLVRVTKRACSAGKRAIMKNDRSNEDEEECSKPVVHTLLGRTVHVLGEMYHAALTPPDGNNESLDINHDQSTTRKKRRKRRRRQERHTTSPTTIVCNGGGMEPSPSSNHAAILQLAKQYDIELPTNENHQLPKKYEESILLSTHTTLNEALNKANANARFLICYISKGGSNNNKNNAIAMPNLLSPEVVKVINRKPLGKKQSGNSGSYYIWIANDDKDVEAAMKRLKVKPPTSRSKSSSKKKKSSSSAPVLTIVYPATAVDTSGKLRVSPRVLAQHHCHPPPSSPETLVAWTNTLRKRHLREFAKLQHDRKEMELFQERTKGYVSSMNEDKVREEKTKQELQLKQEEEEREQLRVQQMEERRKELLESLPAEPEAGSSEGIITIALRFTNGKRDQRRFLSGETSTNDVFDWIDAVHGLEREKVELSTMNGARTFAYVEQGEKKEYYGESGDGSDEEEGGEGEKNVTLEEAGLGKMTALRVTEIVVAEEDGEDEDEANGDEDEESEEDE